MKNWKPLLNWIFCVLTFCIVFVGNLLAQPKQVYAPVAPQSAKGGSFLEQMQSAYPNAKAIFISKKKTLVISLDKYDSVRVVAENKFEMLHLRQKSDQFATESIPFSKFNQILSIDAYTKINEQGKQKFIKAKDFVTGSIVSKNWFYDDYKEKTFLFPSIEPGATTVLNYREAIKEPRFLGVFYVNSYVPVKKSEYSVLVDKNIQIEYKVYGGNKVKIDFSKKKIGEQVLYSWKAADLSEYKTEKDAPNISYYEPHIIVYITHIKGKPLLANPAGLYQWYHHLVKDVNKDVLPEIQQLVDTLVKDRQTEMEKAKVIFHWVQSHIKYIAIEDGLSGFVPRSANEVYNNRYGDCKDMTSIMVTMLKAAKIPAYLGWIGTRKLPYSYNDVPTPMVDNHMIAVAQIDNKEIFLDATDSYVPFGMPTAMIQGKEAMVGLDSQHYEIKAVPITPSEQNYLVDTTWLEIEDENLKGSGKAVLQGYYKSNFSAEVAEQKLNEQKENLISLLDWKHITPEIQQIQYRQAENDDQKLLINYDFVIEKHCKTTQTELYLNLHLDRKFQYEAIQIEKRKTDKEIEYLFNELRCYSVNIPKNYKISFVPENSSFSNEKFGFDIQYEVKENQITMKKKIYYNVLFMKDIDFKAWNEMVKKLDNAYRNSIKLSKLD